MPIRQVIKRALPLSILTSYRRAKFLLRNGDRPEKCQSVFEKIHDSNHWGSRSSVSGPGSEMRETEDIRSLLPPLLCRLDIKSFLDAPCGDFSWMKHVDLSGCDYIGADVVPALIERNQAEYERPGRRFVHADLTKDSLPKADIILCRDCLIHLSFKEALATIKNFQKSGACYVLMTTDPTVKANRPVRTGGYRALNMQLAPFNFPHPQELHRDRYSAKDGRELIDPNKSIGLYRLCDLRLSR
jgi:SAM-dependent methyltransferase